MPLFSIIHRLNVILSLHSGEETSSSKNLSNLSYIISENTEGDYPCFLSTPLRDSLKHEDVKQNPEFCDIGCCDLSTSSSDHDIDSIVVNLSKTLVYDDLFLDEVETP